MLVETRPYFVFGDVLANVVSGALIGLLVTFCIGTGWNMVVAMIIGMVLGMVLAIPMSFAFAGFFGASNGQPLAARMIRKQPTATSWRSFRRWVSPISTL